MSDPKPAELVDLVSLLRVRDLARELGRHQRAKCVSKASLERAMRTLMGHTHDEDPRAVGQPWSHDLEPE